MIAESPKTIAKRLYDDPILSPYTEKQRVYISYSLAVEIKTGKLKSDNIPIRLKNMVIPGFQNEVVEIEEAEVKKLPINRQIEYYFYKGLSARDIMDKVHKTYTRVKNITKKLRDDI